jgi:hypothetical protein
MSWQWAEDEEDDNVEGTNPEIVQIYHGNLMDLVKSPSDSYRKDLAIVPLPPYSRYRKSMLGRAGMLLLIEIKDKHEVGDLISVKVLVELGASIGLREKQVIRACNRLWGRGYLRKRAMGIWREGQIKRSLGKVGKHFGVHYELLEKR